MIVLSGGCAPPSEASAKVLVLAAASTTELVPALLDGFSAAEVSCSFGPSNALARQVQDGAPADLIVVAHPAWMGELRRAGELAGEPVLLARGALVCASRPSSVVAMRSPRDPGALLAALEGGARVGIADEGVPAGRYARQSLRATGHLDALRPTLVGQRDVRAVLRAVLRGELEAGFVYESDARATEVEVLFALDPRTHDPVEIWAARTRGSRHPAVADALLAHLRRPEARRALSGAGFLAP